MHFRTIGEFFEHIEMGMRFLMGDTVKQDEGKGKRLLELAAKNGHKWAKAELDKINMRHHT